MQSTLAIIKPDAMAANHAGDILAMYLGTGLRLKALKMTKPEESLVRRFYSDHEGKAFFEPLVAFMTGGPCVFAVLEGEDAVNRVRTINGSTDPLKADSGTIRRLYGTDVQKNAVHGSDSKQSADRETGIIFAGETLY